MTLSIPDAKATNARPLLERFWERVNKNGPTVRPELGPCWEWTRALREGYGAITVRYVTYHAHRISWEIAHGVPPDKSVLHHCDNRKCVRPDHLFLGTQADNMADMDSKGRRRAPVGETNGQAKLTVDAVREIRAALPTGLIRRESARIRKELAAKYGISQPNITSIVKGIRWRAA